MKVKYEFDQDPRYGWAHIDMEKADSGLIIVVDKDGLSSGFTFSDGEMTPACICQAWSENECVCPNVDWREDVS